MEWSCRSPFSAWFKSRRWPVTHCRSRLPSGTCAARSRSASGTYWLLPAFEPCPFFPPCPARFAIRRRQITILQSMWRDQRSRFYGTKFAQPRLVRLSPATAVSRRRADLPPKVFRCRKHPPKWFRIGCFQPPKSLRPPSCWIWLSPANELPGARHPVPLHSLSLADPVARCDPHRPGGFGAQRYQGVAPQAETGRNGVDLPRGHAHARWGGWPFSAWVHSPCGPIRGLYSSRGHRRGLSGLAPMAKGTLFEW